VPATLRLCSRCATPGMEPAGPMALGGGRVQTRAHQPVGESPTEAKRLRPCSWGGVVARKQDGGASDNILRKEYAQHTRLQRAVNADVASSHANPVAETVHNAKATRGDRTVSGKCRHRHQGDGSGRSTVEGRAAKRARREAARTGEYSARQRLQHLAPRPPPRPKACLPGATLTLK